VSKSPDYEPLYPALFLLRRLVIPPAFPGMPLVRLRVRKRFEFPTSSFQGRAGLIFQDERLDFLEAHFTRYPSSGSVQERARILPAVGNQAGYFSDQVLIRLPPNRAADNRGPDNCAPSGKSTNCEPMTDYGLMMAMPGGN
jgi:hypothetical protein